MTSDRREEADAAFQHAIAIAERQPGIKHPTCGAVLHNCLAFLQQIGRKGEAKALRAQ